MPERAEIAGAAERLAAALPATGGAPAAAAISAPRPPGCAPAPSRCRPAPPTTCARP